IAQSGGGPSGRGPQQGVEVVDADDVGQRAAPLGTDQRAGGAVVELPQPHPVLVEGAQARLLARERCRLVVREPGSEEAAEIVAIRLVETLSRGREPSRELAEIADVSPDGVRRGPRDAKEMVRELVDGIHAADARPGSGAEQQILRELQGRSTTYTPARPEVSAA